MSAGRWSARREGVGLLGTRPVHRVVELLEEEREALVRTRRPRLGEAPGLISWALQLLSTASRRQSEHPGSGVEVLSGHMPSWAVAAGTGGCVSWTLNPWQAVLSSVCAASRLSTLTTSLCSWSGESSKQL